ncbi:hypothetical protein ACA910_002116 [Epithemia clementina (nom. ined.)]
MKRRRSSKDVDDDDDDDDAVVSDDSLTEASSCALDFSEEFFSTVDSAAANKNDGRQGRSIATTDKNHHRSNVHEPNHAAIAGCESTSLAGSSSDESDSSSLLLEVVAGKDSNVTSQSARLAAPRRQQQHEQQDMRKTKIPRWMLRINDDDDDKAASTTRRRKQSSFSSAPPVDHVAATGGLLRPSLKTSTAASTKIQPRGERASVRIEESRNLYHKRPLPVLTLQERQDCWYTRTECLRGVNPQSAIIGNSNNDDQQPVCRMVSEQGLWCLANAYKDCCARDSWSPLQIESIRAIVLEQDGCTGLEQWVLETSVEAIRNDKHLRRQKLLETVQQYNQAIKSITTAEPVTGSSTEQQQQEQQEKLAQRLRDKCQFITMPAQLYALGLGQAQQQIQHDEQQP